MPGTFMRASAIMPPGMFLSQPMTTTPSIHWPWAAVSIQSAMTSRDASRILHALGAWTPSEMVGVPGTCGFAFARRMASMAASAVADRYCTA